MNVPGWRVRFINWARRPFSRVSMPRPSLRSPKAWRWPKNWGTRSSSCKPIIVSAVSSTLLATWCAPSPSSKRAFAWPAGAVIRVWIALALNSLAYCRLQSGAFAQSATLAHEALCLLNDLGDHLFLVHSLLILAGVATEPGQTQRAACLFGAAEALQAQPGQPLMLALQSPAQTLVTMVRTGLGEQAFQHAWTEGATLPQAEAVAYALE